MANFTSQGLNNYFQNDLPLRIHPVRDDKGQINFPDFPSYFLGRGWPDSRRRSRHW